MICIYGNSGLGSFGQVSRGMKEAAEELGLLGGYVLADTAHDGEELVAGGDAPVSLLCGDPGYAAIPHRIGSHRKHYLLLAPNSNAMAPQFLDFMNQKSLDGRPLIDAFVAPSSWARGVLQQCFPEHEVLLSPHGVHKEFRVHEQMRQFVRQQYATQFNVLHVTSSMTDRKGTPQLIEAYKELGWKDSALLILSHPMHIQFHERLAFGVDNIVVHPTMSMTNQDMRLAYSAAHVVCQPSRAEGFGLTPLEARCCGVPVVMTLCTGHNDHAGEWARVGEDWFILPRSNDGIVVVEHGPDEPSDDFPGATAPSVTVAAIKDALETARYMWQKLDEQAMSAATDLAAEWTWANQNELALRKILEDQ